MISQVDCFASLAMTDLILLQKTNQRHCERSEAIHQTLFPKQLSQFFKK